MKRIVLWIDVEDEDVEQVCKRLEKFLNSIGTEHKMVDVCEIQLVGDSK